MVEKFIIDTNICIDIEKAFLAQKYGRPLTSSQQTSLNLFHLHQTGKIKLCITPRIYHEWITMGHKRLEMDNHPYYKDIKVIDNNILSAIDTLTLTKEQHTLSQIIAKQYLKDSKTSGLIDKNGNHVTAMHNEIGKYNYPTNWGDAVIFAQASVYKLPIITQNVKDFLPKYQAEKLMDISSNKKHILFSTRSFYNTGVDNINSLAISDEKTSPVAIRRTLIYHPKSVLNAITLNLSPSKIKPGAFV